ncbi:Protein mpe1 [Extremus antarcticus]|uniref:Protein mpe1 n=1 Tax=Extremus antarcticus TaxID=702011 RepID=A0AAJ0GIE1_9PEZI|nr:Protein mpe1 [Extremus antarcticus]
MSSSIFFRFKSQKEPLQITFDGTSLSVFEVKREIITLSKLGDGTDFDLEIYAADSNEKYDDDTDQIPRSSTVIARRLPAAKQGAGKAARYVTGRMPVNAKNAHRIESHSSTRATPTTTTNGGPIGGGKEMTEEEKLQAILSANTQSWKAEQEAASHKPVVRSYNKSTAVPDKPLPPGYICHRCGEKGHWIQACPTNNDPNFDNRPKFRRTTGIPRSFLKVVEKPTELGEDGKVDMAKMPAGVMYTANGEWVIAEPDKATWDKIQEKTSAAAEKAKEASAGDKELRERGLECSLHNGAFNDPTKTPCCGKTYCRDCIENALLDGDLLCPNCGEQVLLDKLEPDDEMVAKIKAFEEEKKAEKLQKVKEESKSPAAAAGSPQASIEGGRSPSAIPEVKIESAASTPNSKKRSAQEELPNDRKPANPAETAVSKQGTPTPASSNTPKPVQPPVAPAKDMAEFQRQMSAMAASMSGMQNGMPAMMNPMMQGFNPAMMGMGMPMNPAMMGMGPMNGMGGMNGMNGMGNNMNGWGGNQMMGNGGGWQNGNGRGGMQGGFGRGGMQNGGNNGNDGPYMRQPVNPHRQRGKWNRPRGQDYRQL